jgi:hypothetical protein
VEVALSEGQRRLYSKLYVSCTDIDFARYCAGVLLKKGWHGMPWERRGTIYQQQAAFTTSLVTAYARPFTRSHGWPKIPPELIIYDRREQELHETIIALRHKVYAHSDSESYSVRPWRSGSFATDILGSPTLRLTAAEAALFQVMTAKIMKSMRARMKAILAAA